MMTTHDSNETGNPSATGRVRALTDEFRTSRLNQGQQAADQDFFRPVLQEWLNRVGSGSGTGRGGTASVGQTGQGQLAETAERVGTTGANEVVGLIAKHQPGASPGRESDESDFILRLGVGLQESPAMRDAILLSLISKLPPARLIEIGTRPLDPTTAQLVARTLSDLFHSQACQPDRGRCQRGVNLLGEVDMALPVGYTVQAKAVMAYVLWWLDLPETASRLAWQCLQSSHQCVLAKLLLGFLQRQIPPPWKEGGGQEQQQVEQ